MMTDGYMERRYVLCFCTVIIKFITLEKKSAEAVVYDLVKIIKSQFNWQIRK